MISSRKNTETNSNYSIASLQSMSNSIIFPFCCSVSGVKSLFLIIINYFTSGKKTFSLIFPIFPDFFLTSYKRERTLFATNIYRNTMHTIETKVKWQADRTGISPTSWPPCEKKKKNTNT